jgi:hypothetical protein
LSPKGRPEGEYRSAQREGDPLSPKGRPEGEYRSAQREGTPVSAEPKRRSAGDTADPIASPCISVCVLDANGVLCLGCFRTLDEIAAWSLLDADAKRGVLAALPERRSAHRPP